ALGHRGRLLRGDDLRRPSDDLLGRLPEQDPQHGPGQLLLGACTVGLGLTPVFWVYVLFMGILGVSMPFFNTPATVLLQQKVEDAFLGRVFGINSMIAHALMPLTMLFYGPLADVIPIEWMLLATGTLLVVQSLLLASHRALLEAGEPMPELQA